MSKGIKELEDVTAIQVSNGNWNYSEYMWGMANGLILALAIMKDEDPKYLEKPDMWLKNLNPPVELGTTEISGGTNE